MTAVLPRNGTPVPAEALADVERVGGRDREARRIASGERPPLLHGLGFRKGVQRLVDGDSRLGFVFWFEVCSWG